MERVLGSRIRKRLSGSNPAVTTAGRDLISVVSNSIPPSFVNCQVVSTFQFELLRMLFANRWFMIKNKTKKTKKQLILPRFPVFQYVFALLQIK